MWLFQAIAASLLLVSAFYQDEGTTNEWLVFDAESMANNELCSALNCQEGDVCLVQANRAFCVRADKLSEIDGLKMDSKTGVVIKEDKKTITNSRLERIRQHKMKLKLKKENEINEVDSQLKTDIKTNQNLKPTRHDTTSAPECNESELKSMGGRLKQWFSDVHAAEKNNGDVGPLPEHHIQCSDDVGWFFNQWDGDNDGQLTIDELHSVEGDIYETCIKPFLDRCDNNADQLLSLDEWCNCFLWIGRDHDEPPCHKAEHNTDPYAPNAFIPRCDIDGFYQVEQCTKEECWCVDKWGREFDKSRVAGKKPDCGQYATPTETEKESNDFEL